MVKLLSAIRIEVECDTHDTLTLRHITTDFAHRQIKLSFKKATLASQAKYPSLFHLANTSNRSTVRSLMAKKYNLKCNFN